MNPGPVFPSRCLHHRRPAARGLSLIELMVGLTVGLIVVAATTGLYLSQARGSSRLMIEARLHQELRQAMDLIVTDLRRAGYWTQALSATQAGSGVRTNPFALIDVLDDNTLVSYGFNTGLANEQYGFRNDTGVLKMLTVQGTWQALIDPDLVVVEDFSGIIDDKVVRVPGTCRTPCTSTPTHTCPTLLITTVQVRLTARATRDGSIRRTLTATVRPRNERWIGSCPT